MWTKNCEQKLLTKVVNKNFEQILWKKFWTKVENERCEQKLWTKVLRQIFEKQVVDRGCD